MRTSRLRVLSFTLILSSGLASGATAQSIDSSRAAANELFSDALFMTSQRAPAPTFAPKFGGFITARYNANVRDNPDGFSDWTIGGQMAYTKLNVSGNVLDESISYWIRFKFGEADGMAVLDDAYMDFKFEDEWNFRVGQFKPPVLREENISDTKQLAANRSVMNSVFSQSRTQGVQLTYTAPDFRLLGSFNDGIRTANVDYVGQTEADFAGTARLEYKIGGDWKGYDEFTSFPDAKYFGALGAAVHYQEGGDSYAAPQGFTNNVNIWLVTVDAMAKGDGWNVYAAGVLRSQEQVAATSRTTFDDKGFLLQGGWFVRPRWELFARYDAVFSDSRRALEGNFNTLTFGANRYISPNSHAVKLTFDVQWFLDRQSDQTLATQNTLTGQLTSVEENQLAFRAQLQMVF